MEQDMRSLLKIQLMILSEMKNVVSNLAHIKKSPFTGIRYRQANLICEVQKMQELSLMFMSLMLM